MIEPKISATYANALFELALETDCLDSTCLDMISVSEVFQNNKELLTLLSLPTLTKTEKIDIINKVFEDDGSILFDFICLLTEKDRIDYFVEISKEFKALYNKHNNIEEVTITTSIPLTQEERNKLIVKLQNKLSKRIKLTEVIDPAIIGGVKLAYGDSLVDNSVSSRLKTLSKQLKHQI